MKVGGAEIDDLRSKLPNKDMWLAEQRDPPVTLALRSQKREFLLRLADSLRSLGCVPPTVPRLDASLIPDDETEIVQSADDDHYDLRIAIADRIIV